MGAFLNICGVVLASRLLLPSISGANKALKVVGRRRWWVKKGQWGQGVRAHARRLSYAGRKGF